MYTLKFSFLVKLFSSDRWNFWPYTSLFYTTRFQNGDSWVLIEMWVMLCDIGICWYVSLQHCINTNIPTVSVTYQFDLLSRHRVSAVSQQTCSHWHFFCRVLNMEELPWTEEEEEATEHPYYNNIPGKMPPPGGFIDTRLTNQSAAPDGCQVPLSLTINLKNSCPLFSWVIYWWQCDCVCSDSPRFGRSDILSGAPLCGELGGWKKAPIRTTG